MIIYFAFQSHNSQMQFVLPAGICDTVSEKSYQGRSLGDQQHLRSLSLTLDVLVKSDRSVALTEEGGVACR